MSSPPGVSGRTALLRAAHEELIDHGHAAISLRAVARRAGVSHAAPKHHFADRRGLLTAVAVEGFEAFARALQGPTDGSDGAALATIGRRYIDFGLANGPLFDLMWRPSELHTDDPALRRAQDDAFDVLTRAVARTFGDALDPADVPDLALMAWAEVHGLVTLVRDGVLGRGRFDDAEDAMARRVADLFAARLLRTEECSTPRGWLASQNAVATTTVGAEGLEPPTTGL